MGWSVQRDLSKTLVPTCGFQLELNGTHAQTVCVLQPQRAQGFDGYFVGQMRQPNTADQQAAFDTSFGCMTKAEADAFDRVIEDGCEPIDP